tara:strand:- start:415 stop:849 length:435 start_codon:yes stop_codon:yes gene_type:complete
MAVRSENSLNSVQAAIFTALNGNVTWDSANVPVYDLPQPGTAYPYVLIGDDIDVPFDSHSTPGTSTDLTIDVWTKSEGRKDCKGIARAVDVLIDRVGDPPSFTVSGYKTVILRRLESRTLRDESPEGNVLHRAITRYNLILMED